MNRSVTSDRRTFLKASALGLLSVSITGTNLLLAPAQARAKGIPLKVLTDAEAQTLEALGETLHPGSGEAGLVHFIDQQLAVDPDDCMSLVKYFVNDPPFIDFYRAGFQALNGYCQARFSAQFADLKAPQQVAVVKTIGRENPVDWSAPPAPLFYMVVRNDTTDVLYGTLDGFKRLGVPYMPHILPPERW